ncbi:MAG: hypothetical protein HY704_07680, partial [Gemmatimonadetes bacterium]|nr:hypothetical protein [Gemmatimonadota bacterium]
MNEIFRFVVSRPVQRAGPGDKRINRAMAYARTGPSPFASRVVTLADPKALVTASEERLAAIRRGSDVPDSLRAEHEHVALLLALLERQDRATQERTIRELAKALTKPARSGEPRLFARPEEREALRVRTQELADELLASVAIGKSGNGNGRERAALIGQLRLADVIERLLGGEAEKATPAEIRRWLRARIVLPSLSIRRVALPAAIEGKKPDDRPPHFLEATSPGDAGPSLAELVAAKAELSSVSAKIASVRASRASRVMSERARPSWWALWASAAKEPPVPPAVQWRDQVSAKTAAALAALGKDVQTLDLSEAMIGLELDIARRSSPEPAIEPE